MPFSQGPLFDYGPTDQDGLEIQRQVDIEMGAFGPPPIPSSPTTPPGPGWTWKGPTWPGPGAWVSPDGKEKLHPDLNHDYPKGPHWGWKDPYGNKWDFFPDTGKWQPHEDNKPNRPEPTFPPGTLEIVAVEIGAGVIIYIIIRTGGRIFFPPSNAIPVFP